MSCNRPMITWIQIGNHFEGTHEFGKAWIRLGRDNRATALYLLTWEKEKYPVEDEDEADPETLKVKAELLLQEWLLSNNLKPSFRT